MRFIIFYFVIFFFPHVLFSQQPVQTITVRKDIPKPKDTIISIMTRPEVMPEFPGGNKKLHEFISLNLVKPANCPKGSVFTRFVVTKTGEVSDIRIINSLNPACDKAAMDVLKKLPKFKPAENAGRKVDCPIDYPIDF